MTEEEEEEEEEHMMYGQLQWCVVFFHEERELDGS
ncbi:hypothetical protein BVRB_4g090430 [Beta vulgaris subsp. vulgaris]|nr:hypothetical protein BVRB_4g090430 [Beta vulgaris subsp. vulgaris]